VAAVEDTKYVTRRSERLASGELEALVMDLLWEQDDWVTPGDLVELIEDQHPLAYTTVMTILVRLWNKQMVERREQGRGFAYHPILTRDEWAAQRMHEFLGSGGDRAAVLTYFVSTLSEKQLGQLRRAVSRRRGR